MGTPATPNEYLIAVGRVVHNASMVDLIVFNVFHRLSGMSLDAARAVYYAPDAISVKEKMIQRLAHKEPDEIKSVINDLLAAARRANAKRNELAHAMLSSKDPTSGEFQRYQPKEQTQSHRPISREYLDSMVKPTSAAVAVADDQWVSFCQKRGIDPSLYG